MLKNLKSIGKGLLLALVAGTLLTACSGGSSPGDGDYGTATGGDTGIAISPGSVQTIDVATVSGALPGADGYGSEAHFSRLDYAVYLNGFFYITDMNNYTVRKYNPSTGEVTTLAGQAGMYGYADGTGTAATFGQTKGIATDGTYLYVAAGCVIRKIDPVSAKVTTFSGKAGEDTIVDGAASVARFSSPYGLACDGTYLYVAEPWESIIRRITISTGEVSTIAGKQDEDGMVNATGGAARFNFPHYIAYDSGNLYVSDQYNNAIRKIVLSTSAVTTLAGSGSQASADGNGTSASFYYPAGIVCLGGNIYVADNNNQTIRKITESGDVTTIAGKVKTEGYADGVGNAARFNYPDGLFSDGTNLYVGDNVILRKLEIATSMVTTVAGAAYFTDGAFNIARFNDPYSIKGFGTTLFVADAWNYAIRMIDTVAGMVSTLAGTGSEGIADGTGTAASFHRPTDMVSDGTYVYVCDCWNYTIRKITISTGVVTTLAGQVDNGGFADGSGTAAQFNDPTGIALIGSNLYVTEFYNYTIRKVDTVTGAVSLYAGSAGVDGSADGDRLSARFNGPWGITSSGTDLYISEAWNNTIRKIDTVTGNVTTVAGTAGVTGSTNGTGAAAKFDYPQGLATDGVNLYVADSSNNTIRKIVLSSGAVTTLAGKADDSGLADGSFDESRFSSPGGLYLTGGFLYVADTSNSLIRRIKLP